MYFLYLASKIINNVLWIIHSWFDESYVYIHILQNETCKLRQCFPHDLLRHHSVGKGEIVYIKGISIYESHRGFFFFIKDLCVRLFWEVNNSINYPLSQNVLFVYLATLYSMQQAATVSGIIETSTSLRLARHLKWRFKCRNACDHHLSRA